MRWRESAGGGFENRSAAHVWCVSTGSAETAVRRPRQWHFQTVSERLGGAPLHLYAGARRVQGARR